jgi:branched-chain amino acid transport system ATP-binding protein
MVSEMFRIIERLHREQGIGVLLVEQNVALSLALCERAYVLENGRIVLSGSGSGLLEDDRVRQAYLGS